MGALTTRADYERHLVERHRPHHATRRAERWASFLLPHLRPGMRVLDLGCGPCSITVDLGDAIGIDLDPVPAGGVPVLRADAAALPVRDASVDAVFACALLQHVRDPLAVLVEARRVARPGAVVGVADADWGGAVLHPHEPLIDRGIEIQERLRSGNARIGRQLAALLAAAGFERCEASAVATSMGTVAAVTVVAAFEGSWFTAPEVVAHVTELAVSDAEECAAIAAAWRRWGATPGAFAARFWITALAWAPT
jgi:SAM-dependent methyltransferase